MRGEASLQLSSFGDGMLNIQDPTNPESPHVFEALLEASSDATRGGGAFAFASADGVSLLVDDDGFSTFLDRSPFELVVGVDAVTNLRTLARLSAVAGARRHFSARVFVHEEKGALFHPKIAWFQRSDGSVRVIAGSGNLTLGGMRGHWEAFEVVDYPQKSGTRIIKLWEQFVEQHDGRLLEPDDERAKAEAAGNKGWSSKRRSRIGAPVDESADLKPADVSQSLLAHEALVAEIGGGPRWKQANFPKEIYQDFFGARVGTQRRVVLQEVRAGGVRRDPESRPSVEVKSQNYRFELGAAAGLPYPATGRPIAVFIKQPGGLFLYELTMPGTDANARLAALLTSRYDGPSRELRRVTTNGTVVSAAYPKCLVFSVKPEE